MKRNVSVIHIVSMHRSRISDRQGGPRENGRGVARGNGGGGEYTTVLLFPRDSRTLESDEWRRMWCILFDECPHLPRRI